MKKTILVVGGAGYIGAHMVLALEKAGYNIIVLDDLSSGRRSHVLAGEFIQGSVGDYSLLKKIFHDASIDAVLHFASLIQAGESVVLPAKYYEQNVANTLILLNAMIEAQVKQFIFSSSAAIYGQPLRIPIDIDHPKSPINPYGRTKWIVEQVLQDYDHAYGLKSICLRYFNAAGADPDGRIGECHEPESHLIPLILQVASGKRDKIKIYGQDYPTPDGTAIRDYIHVHDLCTAHLLALTSLEKHNESRCYNLGNGQGFSVNTVIKTARHVTGRAIPAEIASRRPGDPAILVADATSAHQKLGWIPQYPHLKDIIEHAWRWECR